MTDPHLSSPGKKNGIMSDQTAIVELLECVRLLHERGNLASGLTVVNYLRRISGSRVGSKKVRATAAIMQILRNIEARGCIEINWSASESRPYIVRLTSKGYGVIEGHECHAAMCCPPILTVYEVDAEPLLEDGGAELYFIARLHECGNRLDPQDLRRVFDYLEVKGRARSQFVCSLESLGWVEVERTPTQPRPTLIQVRLLLSGLRRLHGHQCGANCMPPQSA